MGMAKVVYMNFFADYYNLLKSNLYNYHSNLNEIDAIH